jgi:hypothetical protein
MILSVSINAQAISFNTGTEYYFADTVKTYDTLENLIKLEIYQHDSINHIITCRTPLLTYGGPYNATFHFDSFWNLIQADVCDTQNTFAYQYLYNINYDDSSIFRIKKYANNDSEKYLLKYGTYSGIVYWRYSCRFVDSIAAYSCDTVINSLDSTEHNVQIKVEKQEQTEIYTYDNKKRLVSRIMQTKSLFSPLKVTYVIEYDSHGRRFRMLEEHLWTNSAIKRISYYIYSQEHTSISHYKSIPQCIFPTRTLENFKSDNIFNLLGRKLNSSSTNVIINKSKAVMKVIPFNK